MLTISSASVCARIFSDPILASAKLAANDTTRRMVERMARYFMADANEEGPNLGRYGE